MRVDTNQKILQNCLVYWRIAMNKDRTELTKEEEYILDKAKEMLTDCITELLERGVRPANIQIELEWHIRKLLKSE
jgi:hypothetical protein